MESLALLGESVNGTPARGSAFRTLLTSSAAPSSLRLFGYRNGKLALKQKNVRELPCADCRGRGYLCCKECDITNPRASCFQCAGKGVMVCRQCHGECVVQGKSILAHQVFWEKLHSDSSIKVKDDEIIENMSISATPVNKRVYGPVSAATREKIRNALKDLERRTGSLSSRMKRLSQDPVLHAQRVSAIQKAKQTEKSRKNISAKLIAFFKNPENRLKQSIRMKGIKYFCKACGGEGHRKNFCPSLKVRVSRAPSQCSFCGTLGHRINTCPSNERRLVVRRAPYKCTNCHAVDHNSRTCPLLASTKRILNMCSVCKTPGHNKRTCTRMVNV